MSLALVIFIVQLCWEPVGLSNTISWKNIRDPLKRLWLEENDFKIESIFGCSMSAFIGRVYAAGKLEDFKQWIGAISKVDIFTLLDLPRKKNAFITSRMT